MAGNGSRANGAPSGRHQFDFELYLDSLQNLSEWERTQEPARQLLDWWEQRKKGAPLSPR